MIYIIIFLVTNAIGVLTGYLVAKFHTKPNDIGGSLHVITQEDEESPYIFLELENEEVLEGKSTITLTIKRSAEKT